MTTLKLNTKASDLTNELLQKLVDQNAIIIDLLKSQNRNTSTKSTKPKEQVKPELSELDKILSLVAHNIEQKYNDGNRFRCISEIINLNKKHNDEYISAIRELLVEKNVQKKHITMFDKFVAIHKQKQVELEEPNFNK